MKLTELIKLMEGKYVVSKEFNENILLDGMKSMRITTLLTKIVSEDELEKESKKLFKECVRLNKIDLKSNVERLIELHLKETRKIRRLEKKKGKDG